jgi:starvation-inducible DNA-binding protein
MAQAATVLSKKARDVIMKTGLADKYRKNICEQLSGILAATYQLTIKSHIYHWNVVGPLFQPLHELTEEHYKNLFEAADIIAERIRSLGHLAPYEFADVTEFSPAAEAVSKKTAKAMIEDLIVNHEQAVRDIREAGIEAGDAHDLVTEDMLTQRLAFHEKAIWMLRAIDA